MIEIVPIKKAIDLPTRRRVAAYVQRYLDRKHMSMEALEKKLGVGAGTVSRLLSGRSLGFDVFIKINRILLIDAEDLLNRDPPPHKPHED